MLIVCLLLLCTALVFTPLTSSLSLRNTTTRDALLREDQNAREINTRRKHFFKRLTEKKEKSTDLGIVVAEVATRLRAGAHPEEAWYQTLKNSSKHCEKGVDEHGVPYALRALLKKPRWFFPKKKSTNHEQFAIPAAIAVCRLSHSSGAPVADVLDSCAAGITEAAEAASARSVALAGPQTSAQMLAWLPLVGVVLGSALGAEPLHFLLSTTAGRLVLVCGIACEIAGIVWVRRLSARAEKV